MAYPVPSPALLSRLAERLGPAGLTTEPADLDPWLTDWRRRLTGSAAALVSPASVEDAAFVVTQAAAEGVALVPQGGNSSMVGGATPAGAGEGRALLVSMRRMRAIRSVSPGDNVVVAEAGTVLADLHAAVEAKGRRFPLSLAAKGNATVGGLVSTNAGGTQVLRFGPMRSLVVGLEAVLPDGSILRGLSPLRKDNRGYDLKQLLIGGEGTLGLVTAAALRLVPAIGERAVAWIGFRTAEQALDLLRDLEDRLGEAVESFELVPAEGLALVLRHIPDTRAPLEGEWPWHVLVEAVGSASGGTSIAERLGEALVHAIEDGRAGDAMIAQSEAQAEALWKLRESMSEAEARDGMAAKPASPAGRFRRLRGGIRRGRAFARAMHGAHPVPARWSGWLTPETLVCRCEEVDVETVLTARDELGGGDLRTAKLLTRCGMGWCQGRVCGFATALLAAEDADRPLTVADLRPGSKRTLAAPLSLGRLAGLADVPPGSLPLEENPDR